MHTEKQSVEIPNRSPTRAHICLPSRTAAVASGDHGGKKNSELLAAGFEELATDLGIETKLTQVAHYYYL